MNYSRPELRDRLASEYVLGTLAGRARRRFKRLLETDRELAAAVEFWQHTLTPMAAPLSLPAPPQRVWDAIEARVAPRAAARLGWFERWFGARPLPALAAGLFIGVGVATLAPMVREAAEPDAPPAAQLPASYAGILLDASGRPALAVSSLRHGRIVDVKVLLPIEAGAGRELQLWALPRNGAPIALGRVPSTGKGRLELPATSEQLLANVGELGVSSEPRGTTPGAPSGSYVLRGACVKFW
jgi:anti-sigma-K factor RskA